MENLARKKERSPPEKDLNLESTFLKGFAQEQNTSFHLEKEKTVMEITVNAIVKELENRGYIVDEQTCIKNGIEVLGLAVKKNEDDKVVPTIYPEDIIKEADERGLTVSEVVEGLIPVIEQRPSIDIDRFTDRDYLLSHVRIGVQKEGNENLVKRNSPFEGIEEYLYIADDMDGQGFSVKLKPQMLEMAGIKAKGLFKVAEANNHEEFTATPMINLISKMMGEDVGAIEDLPMYVISNKAGMKGASAMLDKKSISALADEIGVHEFVLLPSSIHECILVPHTRESDLEMFENMVREVNATTVDPLERLVDRAYLLTA